MVVRKFFWSSFLLILFFIEVDMLEVSVHPKGCICPSQGYTCQANESLVLDWYPTCNTTTGDNLTFSVTRHAADIIRECGGFKINYTSRGPDGQLPTIISTLLVTNHSVNGTDLTCEGTSPGSESNDTIPICIIGSATPPANVTVVMRKLPWAVVTFQPPVYGGQCVDHYTVTAISEEGTDTCTVTNDHHMDLTCSFPILNTTDYNFTVSSVTIGLNDTVYHGDTSTAVLVTMSDDVTDGMNITSQGPDIDVPGAVVPETTDMTMLIAVCTIVVGVLGVLLLIAVVGLVGVIKRKQLGQLCVVVKRKQTSKQVAVRGKEAGDNTDKKDFLIGIKSQASIEDRRYDPPTSAPPAVPQAESPTGQPNESPTETPDVVPSHQVYADVNTLTRKDKDKEGVEGETEEHKTTAEHMYSVVDKSKKKKKTSALTTAEQMYSVVDKSKKKKKTSALPSPTLP